jgi:putative flippase GtrA
MNDFDPRSSTTWSWSSNDDPGAPRRHSVLSLVLLIVGVAVAAALGLSLAFWAFGFLFHILGFVLRIALVVAVAAFVWKRVMRRCSRTI